MNFNELKGILKDKVATQLITIVAILCLVNLALSWFFGSLTLLAFLGALSLSSLFLQSIEARSKVQNVITSILEVQINDVEEPPDDKERVEVEQVLDVAIESFFKKIIKQFISSWYSTLTQDESFVWNIKVELTVAIREIARRLRHVDHPTLISNKLLPVVYSHFEILDRIVHKGNSCQDQISSFVENENSIHPATFSRNAELNYLRYLSKRLLYILVSRKNFECKVVVDLLKEVLTCSVLLPLTDVISDPATINLLVILATSPRLQRVDEPDGKKVILLENFMKKFAMKIVDDNNDEDDENDRHIDGNFLKDQEKLYSFMQHLKSKNSADIDILKFYLDVEHLNAELDKSNVICDPKKLSELQQKSEKLLQFYQKRISQKNDAVKVPEDLLEAHEHARKILEAKWRNDFYKSAEYFQLTYGDKDSSSIPDELDNMAAAAEEFSMPSQKLSTKLKNVMTIRTGTVEGLEATEIPIWDALDHPLGLGHSSYYNSVAVKLRKERGQDLESFMQSFFHSTEQEADVGEDIAWTQIAEESRARQKKTGSNLGNFALYKNLFNITGQSKANHFMTIPTVKSSIDSAIFFLSSILNIHQTFLRFLNGLLRFLPEADAIIRAMIMKFLRKTVTHSIAAKLINELEEKVFEEQPTIPATKEEQLQRFELAKTRIEAVNKNLSKTLSFLQNPVLNKHLMYCLIDVILVDIFPELNLNTKD